MPFARYPAGKETVPRIALAFLAKVIRTESGQMRDRLRAVELLAKMCGWNQPEKVEVGANNELAEVLKRLRGS